MFTDRRVTRMVKSWKEIKAGQPATPERQAAYDESRREAMFKVSFECRAIVMSLDASDAHGGLEAHCDRVMQGLCDLQNRNPVPDPHVDASLTEGLVRIGFNVEAKSLVDATRHGSITLHDVIDDAILEDLVADDERHTPDKPFSVHDQPDFERVYDEDDTIEVRRGDLRALLDLATGSLDFGSGFWDEEQTEVARKIAGMLGVDPFMVTPVNMTCKYRGEHSWQDIPPRNRGMWHGATMVCRLCEHTDPERP